MLLDLLLLWLVVSIFAIALGAAMRNHLEMQKRRRPFLRDVAQARYDAYLTAHPGHEGLRAIQKWKRQISRIPRKLRDTR